MRTVLEENISTASCFQIESCGAESFGTDWGHSRFFTRWLDFGQAPVAQNRTE
jgi:hypothetical protein